jgi:molybdenum cofactor biosynthesis protein B
MSVLTVSDTRTPDTDLSGDLAVKLLEEAGHRIVSRALVPDEPEQVAEWVRSALLDESAHGAITTGGTGISPRDRTYEALVSLLDRKLDGFGELFRSLSYQEIGSAAMLSRATGGIAFGKLLFCLPGSPDAVRLALQKLILPELGHLAAELRKR